MSCEPFRPLLAGRVDAALTDGEAADLDAHLAGCAPCRRALEELQTVRDRIDRTLAAPSPSPEAWADWSRELEARLAREPSPARRPRWAPAWAGPLAVAAGLLVAVAFAAGGAFEQPVVLAGAAAGRLPRIPRAAPARLGPPRDAAPSGHRRTPSGRPGARRRGRLDPRRAGPGDERRADRDDRISRRRRPRRPLPLVTTDAALLIYGGAAARAAASVEATVIVPGLRALLSGLTRELARLEGELWSADLRAAARVARERLGVAALLVDVDPRLSGSSLLRAQGDARQIRAGVRVTQSAVLGRKVDTRALQPTSWSAGGQAALDHARAVRWLATTGLALDEERATEARAACLVVLALARAELPSGRPALALQAQLEATVELLYGEPDELTPLDLLVAIRQAVGEPEVRPSDLGRAEVLSRIVQRAQAVADGRRAGSVRSLNERAPRMFVLGNTRSLEGHVLSRVTAPSLPGRQRPTSLDLLALFGSPTARTVASALPGSDARYDAALSELEAGLAPWRQPARKVPLRASLERGRVWAIAALLDGSEPPFVDRARYRSRALLAALAGLNAPPAPEAAGPPSRRARPCRPWSPPRASTGGSPSRPAGWRRRSFRSRPGRSPVGRGRRGRAPRGRPPPDALRQAALAGARGAPVPPEAATELRRFRSVLARHAPASPASVEPLYELATAGGDLEVLSRLVTRVDRLWLVAPDPATGRPRLACGPALAAGERWVSGPPLNPSDLARVPDPTPPWARHIVRSR